MCRLDPSANTVEDISALGNLSGLVWLPMRGNLVSRAAPLGRLEKHAGGRSTRERRRG